MAEASADEQALERSASEVARVEAESTFSNKRTADTVIINPGTDLSSHLTGSSEDTETTTESRERFKKSLNPMTAAINGGNTELRGESSRLQDPPTGTPVTNLKHISTNITGGSTGKPYSVFTDLQKWFIVVLSALGALFSPISTNIYVPAIPALASAFNVTEEKINLTVTMYLVFQALTPALWASAGDCFGRRPVFMLCLLVYLLSCIGTALTPVSAYWLLIVLRMIQSAGGSPLIAIGTGVVSDIATPQERGRYVGLFNLGTTVGPALGPLLGGLFAFTLGWRSIFWFLAIFCAVVLVPMTLAFPETLRSLVGDGSIPPPLINCTPAALLRRKRELKEMHEKGEIPELQQQRGKFRPWVSFLLFLEPEVALMFTWSSLYYANWYALLTVFSTIMKDQYGVNEIVLGLCYIPNGVACGLSGFLTGRIMDTLYSKEKKRVGGDHRQCPQEFRLERVRFVILPFHISLLLASTIGLAWSVQYRAHIAVPIVLNFFVGLGTGFLTTTTIYGIDLQPRQGGAVTASYNLIRCAFGAVTVSTVQIITNKIGAGWCFVLLSGICLLGSPLLIVLLMWGPGWRLKRIEKEKEQNKLDLAKRTGVTPA